MDLKSKVVYYLNGSKKTKIPAELACSNGIISLTELSNDRIVFSFPLNEIDKYSSNGYELSIIKNDISHSVNFSEKNDKKLAWTFHFPKIVAIILNFLLFSTLEKSDLSEWLSLFKDNKIHQKWSSRIVGLPFLILLIVVLVLLVAFEKRIS